MMHDDSTDTLAGLFHLLKGGTLVAISAGRVQDSVRMIVENRSRLSGIADSWGRVVVTLTGCRRFSFRTEGSVPGVDLIELTGRLKPSLITVKNRIDFCEVGCSCGLMHGTLEIAAEEFSIMLGSGRILRFDEFLEELDRRGDVSYARAS
jgi:hypothetical protein